MLGANSRLPSAIALIGAILGLVFASTSTSDYASHLDRRLHDLHCSFVPGASATDDADACRAAMYSPYSAFLKDQYWGGVPISLFALGAFCFFAAFALYLVLSGGRAPKKSVVFFALVSLTPLIVSIVMGVIAATKLGTFCKTCVGIYISSFVLALGGILGLATIREGAQPPTGSTGTVPGAPYGPPPDAPAARPALSIVFPVIWLAVLGATTFVPAVAYTASLPDHRPYLQGCGKLKKPKDTHNVLLKVSTRRSVQPVTLFEDPLCPTCKAFHERLVAEDIFDKLDVTFVMFPLDNECNWMLDRALHPGACIVSRAVLCGGPQSLKVLEWAYERQEYLTRAGKKDAATLKEVIRRRWGDDIASCVDRKDTVQRLNKHLHYATDNGIPVSTPQMFVGTTRVCEEDTDIGLIYTLGQLAPEVIR